MYTFEPEHFNFTLLHDFRFPGPVAAYELANHPAVTGSKDFLRLNLYLTKDGNYVTIWFGLLEPIGTEMELTTGILASVIRPADLGFVHEAYNQELFKGYIDSDDAASHVFRALRVGDRFRCPQVLHAGADNELRCDYLSEDDLIASV